MLTQTSLGFSGALLGGKTKFKVYNSGRLRRYSFVPEGSFSAIYFFKSSFKIVINNLGILLFSRIDLPRVISVGRLDIKSEGLLLLTTNPKLSSYLENPSNKIERRYIVKVSGKIPENLDKLVEGQFLVDGILYNEIKIKLSNSEEKNMMEVKLTEGKNREIRKVLNYFNLKVQKLKRISFGPFELNDIGIGNLVEIEIKFLDKLLNSIGFTDENNFRQI